MDDESSEASSCNMCDAALDNLVFCEGCEAYYCDEPCWRQLKSHRKQGLGAGGVPHGKSRPEIVEMIKKSMAEPRNDFDEKEQHVRDVDSVWFGLSQDDGGEPALADYRRYATVMMESNPETSAPRYPGLVSFIGPTGSGKSTLIKLLIERARDGERGVAVDVPVIGRKDCDIPTSSDVHLYIDPDTTTGSRPILFADCEGFEGGERDPMAQQTTALQGGSAGTAHDIKRATRAVTKRVLKWASRNSQQSEQTSKRQYAVSEMYPRIFHAFSDVVIFVLNNPKTMEDVVEKLLKWADANHSTSINMPCKPHAIIAINKSQNSAPNELWNPLITTREFFKSMGSQINKNPTILKYVEKWRSSNAPINDIQELFERYYWTITVVRLPEKSRYELMHRQRDELREIITNCCQSSLRKRKAVSILPDVDEFGMYLSLAFDHFSQTLDKPFDYVKASIQYRPPPEALEDNLLEFIILVEKALRAQGKIESILNAMTRIVASYFILDSSRKQRMGQPQHWFETNFTDLKREKTAGSDAAVNSYYSICESAVDRYFAWFVPCQYERPSNNLTLYPGFKCEVVQACHGDKFHRMSSKWRQDIYGEFQHKFIPENFAWARRILGEFRPLHGRYMANGSQDQDTPRRKAVRGHAGQLEQFFSKVNLFSNRICLSCLFNVPTIRLRCGHVICHECALDFGMRIDITQVQIDHCPLHPGRADHATGGLDILQLDPPNAGLRVLVLDGGGVRGIVELCVLQAIEDYLGVPLQSFFELVIGTSTGGIISLGFGHELWSVEECMKRFTSLVSSAFTPRSIQKYKGVKYIERVIKRSKYRTRPFEEALRGVFSDSALFAPRKDSVVSARRSDHEDADKKSIGPSQDSKPLKVAVAAVSEAGRTPYLLSNYNVGLHHSTEGESGSKPLHYERARPEEDSNELRTWEAARATSAAPGFFKPFKSKRFDLPFMDGAILHNNPIQLAIEEARRLSQETNLNAKPDIVLSVGTGKPKDKQPADIPEYAEYTASKSLSRAQAMMKHEKHMPFLQMLFTMVGYQIKLNVDCDRRYDQVAREWQKDPDLADRLHRINPDLGEEPPVLDAVDKVDSIAQNTRGWLQDKDEKRHIHAIACRLVASSFYFERRGNASKGQGSSIDIKGAIRCRISEKAEVVALGEFLSSCRSDPTLVIINYTTHDREIKMPIETMVSHGRFDPVDVDITVLGEDAVTSIELKLERQGLQDQRLFRLSGFPRKLIKEDFKKSRMS